jgi:hypothetical protein
MVPMASIAKVDGKCNAFVENTHIQVNGIGLPAIALCDTGAQTHLLVSPTVARRARKQLQARVTRLDNPIQLLDYRKQPAGRVEKKLIATLEIDGRRFPDQSFLVTETGHDVFIGLRWMEEHGLLLDCKNHKIIWPDDLPALAKFSPAIELPPRCLLDRYVRPEIQKDADRRDKAMAKAEKKYRILRRPWRRPERSDILSNAPQTEVLDASNSVPELKTDQTTPSISALEAAEDQQVIAALVSKIEADPRRKRWESLINSLPQEIIPFETQQDTDEIDPVETEEIDDLTSIRQQIAQLQTQETPSFPNWKTFDGKRIPFPADEDPTHIELVRSRLPKQLAHLEGFFSRKEADTLPDYRPGHDVVLELERPPPASGPPRYRTPIQYLPLEREIVDKLLKMDFIEPCMQPDAASVLFAPKPHSAERRFCIDFRWRNDHLKPRIVPAPSLNGTMFNCRDARHMSKIDIIQAFHRLRMAVGSEYLTAFRTRQGTFQWKVLPFGLKVGPAWWQQFINAQLQELLDYCASAYADDVLIYSGEEPEHWEHCEEIIYRLHKANLQGDIKKSRFNVSKIDYLGVIMEAGVGISIDPAKIQAIQDWRFEDLTTRSAIRSFLGLCNYVRMFCHHASGIAEPLNRLLKKDTPFKMNEEQRQAFEAMKRLACEAPVLAFFRPGRPTRVETDASRNATGGVVWQQQDDCEWKPVGYFSKTMTPAERAYPIQDRELLAVVQTLEHYCPELLGQKFFVVTDHQALLYFSSKQVLSTRQVRWADFLSNFDITFQYRPGKENVAADALSRKTVDLPTVKARERAERAMALIPPEKINIPIAAISNDSPNDVDVPQGADLVELIRHENNFQGLGMEDGKLLVPEKTSDDRIFLRTALIREAHVPKIFAHPGQNKVIKMLEREYAWPNLKQDVRRYIRNCYDCRRNKTPRDKTPGLLHPLPIPNAVWDHVVVDGKDMPKDRHGYNYVWAFIDKFSRIMATLPGHKTDKAETLAMRYYRYLYRFMGMPLTWISDNGGQFVSRFLAKLNELTGTKHRHGSALHPQSQGAVEFTNQELDQRLRFYIDKYQDDWSEHLPALDFAHNSSWHSAIDMAPLKVAFGRDVRNPLSLDLTTAEAETEPEKKALAIIKNIKAVQDLARNAALVAQKRQETQANKKRRPVDFGVGDKVFLSKKGFATVAPTTRLESQWVGPFKILEERGHSFVLDLPTGYKMMNLFHADRLRKADDNPLPQQVQTPPPPEDINGEPEWEVERIERARLHGRKKQLEYQVSWKGCDPDDNWYPAANFKNAPVALEKFHEEHPNAPGPPTRLRDWVRAAAADEIDGDHTDDNKPHKEGRRAKTRRHD